MTASEDLFELELLMNGGSDHGPEWDAKVERAQSRVTAFNALPVNQQLDILHGRTTP